MKKIIQKLVKQVFGDNSIKISKISDKDISEVLEICAVAFQHVMDQDSVKSFIQSTADWSLSVKAVYQNKIVGCYIFKERSVVPYLKSIQEKEKYKNLKGIEGVALAVLPEYRDLGIGKKLREYPLHLGFDYIWGQHLKGLQNIDNWTKFGRRIVNDIGHLYITLMDLKNNNKSLNETKNFNSFHSFQNAGHTCGPTCVKMVADFLGVDYGNLDHIIELCGCNTTTGTIDTGIKKALDGLGIPNIQNKITNPELAMDFLNNILDKKDIFILRTLTKGIKHWIIVYGKSGDNYLVADPWLGKIEYNYEEIMRIWKPRNFDGFAINI